jgi:hypothetical protein
MTTHTQEREIRVRQTRRKVQGNILNETFVFDATHLFQHLPSNINDSPLTLYLSLSDLLTLRNVVLAMV